MARPCGPIVGAFETTGVIVDNIFYLSEIEEFEPSIADILIKRLGSHIISKIEGKNNPLIQWSFMIGIFPDRQECTIWNNPGAIVEKARDIRSNILPSYFGRIRTLINDIVTEGVIREVGQGDLLLSISEEVDIPRASCNYRVILRIFKPKPIDIQQLHNWSNIWSVKEVCTHPFHGVDYYLVPPKYSIIEEFLISRNPAAEHCDATKWYTYYDVDRMLGYFPVPCDYGWLSIRSSIRLMQEKKYKNFIKKKKTRSLCDKSLGFIYHIFCSDNATSSVARTIIRIFIEVVLSKLFTDML